MWLRSGQTLFNYLYYHIKLSNTNHGRTTVFNLFDQASHPISANIKSPLEVSTRRGLPAQFYLGWVKGTSCSVQKGATEPKAEAAQHRTQQLLEQWALDGYGQFEIHADNGSRWLWSCRSGTCASILRRISTSPRKWWFLNQEPHKGFLVRQFLITLMGNCCNYGVLRVTGGCNRTQ